MSPKRRERCFAAHCKSSSTTEPHLRFFRFPRNPSRSQLWAQRVGRMVSLEEAQTLGEKHKVLCSRHFSEEQFTTPDRIHLNMSAVPSFTNGSTPPSHVVTCPSPSSSPGPSSLSTPVTFQVKQPLRTYSAKRLSPKKLFSQMYGSTTLSTQPSSFQASLVHSTPLQASIHPSSLPSPTHSSPLASPIHSSPPPSPVHLPTSSPSQSLPLPRETSHPLISVSGASSRKSVGSSRLPKKVRRSLLKQLNVRKVSELTPRKKKMYKIIRNAENNLSKLKKRYHVKYIEEISNLDENALMEKVSSNLNENAVILLKSILRSSKQKPKGRRWTLKEKILTLALFKRSPACYRLLRLIFPLPSKRTLQTVLNTVPLRTGINEHLFTALKHSVQEMYEADRICCLMFDEMSIREHLSYNHILDCIEGYEDHGSQGRTGNVANHALVFMVRGLRRKWKQPVAYYFHRGGMYSELLGQLLDEVLDSCFNAGLQVVATVCDLGTNNVKALKMKKCVSVPHGHADISDDADKSGDERKPYFIFKNHEIATVFDPPHILKATRNMFFRHDVKVEFELGGKKIEGIAKWEHIVKLFNRDKELPFVRHYPKLSESHMNPVGQTAMKVKLAAQVMSNTVSAGVATLVSTGILGTKDLASVVFIKDVNDLFDSLNGFGIRPESHKPLCSALRNDSDHISFWDGAKNRVKNWSFFRTRESQPSTSQSGRPPAASIFMHPPPSQEAWINTIDAVLHIWRKVSEEGFDSLDTRSLNQDPLENTFGAIRLHCGANNNPNVVQFVDALKTVIVNDLAFRGLQGTNCEDDGDHLLENLHSFLSSEPPVQFDASQSGIFEALHISDDILHIVEETASDIDDAVSGGLMEMSSVAYVSGFIAKNLLRDSNCNMCKNCLISDSCPFNVLIALRECSSVKPFLTYASEMLVKTVDRIFKVLTTAMNEVAHSDHLALQIRAAIMDLVPFDWLITEHGCPRHHQRIRDGIVYCAILIGIPRWCKIINERHGYDVRQRARRRRT